VVEQGGDVVGAGVEREGLLGADAAAVAPVVGGDDPPAVGELRVQEAEVDVGGGAPAVQKDDGGTAATHEAHTQGPPARHGDARSRSRDIDPVRPAARRYLSETGR
jgi:hypothetical protein